MKTYNQVFPKLDFAEIAARPENLLSEAESKEKHGVWDPMPGVDYNLTLCPIQHIYHGQPESTLILCHSRLYPPVKDLDLDWPLILIPKRTHHPYTRMLSLNRLMSPQNGGRSNFLRISSPSKGTGSCDKYFLMDSKLNQYFLYVRL